MESKICTSVKPRSTSSFALSRGLLSINRGDGKAAGNATTLGRMVFHFPNLRPVVIQRDHSLASHDQSERSQLAKNTYGRQTWRRPRSRKIRRSLAAQFGMTDSGLPFGYPANIATSTK